MNKVLTALFFAFSVNTFAQIEPAVTYDGGDLYFIPAKLTSKGVPFMYSYRTDYNSNKIWFTIFDEEVNVVKQSEIKAQVIDYTTRIITTQRKYFIPYKYGGTRATSAEEGYFLDEWTEISDVTEDKLYCNEWIESPEVYEDNNNYHSREMYLSQTLFNEDDDFEFLRAHYEVMPLSYCATDDKTGNNVEMSRPNFGGEECDEYSQDYNYELEGYIITMIRRKVYGGIKHTGTDVISLDGTVKYTLAGITSLGSVVAIKGNYYVSGYDNALSKYALYKIASTTTSIERVAEITSQASNNVTYSIDGFRVKSNTKGVVIRNRQKMLNR